MTNDELAAKAEQMRCAGINETVIQFMFLQSYTGARMSDLLKLRREDISESLNVVIRQGKGSLPLHFNLSYNRQFWSAYRAGNATSIEYFNYLYFYRLYVRYAIILFTDNQHNNAVTHSFRKNLAQDVMKQSNDIEVVKSALGHKSVRSTEYYITDAQRSNVLKQGVLQKVTGTVSNLVFQNRYGQTIVKVIQEKKKRR